MLVSAPSVELRAITAGAALGVRIEADGSIRGDAEALGVEVERDGSVLRVSVCPRVPVRLRPAIARFTLDGLPEAVYLNGYNSWTDSVEHRPYSTMPGIGHVPRSIVDEWVLDGSGDYRFTRYDVAPGRMHGWAYAYLRQGSQVELVGSLGEDTGFTLLRFDAHKLRPA